MSAPEKNDVPEALPPSAQMRVSERGRRKVPLPPGRSQLDWIRNSQSLLKHRRRPRPLTLEDIKQHKIKTDAWMVVQGTVYDVTPYIEYHPGGIPMIMSGAGKDATALFEKYHPWVNAESMLQSCIIGYLVDTPSTDK